MGKGLSVSFPMFETNGDIRVQELGEISYSSDRHGLEEDCVFPCVCFKLTKNLGKISYSFEFICTVISAENVSILCKI